jgi:hypothetical protein
MLILILMEAQLSANDFNSLATRAVSLVGIDLFLFLENARFIYLQEAAQCMDTMTMKIRTPFILLVGMNWKEIRSEVCEGNCM